MLIYKIRNNRVYLNGIFLAEVRRDIPRHRAIHKIIDEMDIRREALAEASLQCDANKAIEPTTKQNRKINT